MRRESYYLERVIFIVFLLFFNLEMFAVSVPSIFSDGMVLQRNMSVPVWGWGKEGEQITVEIQGQSVSSTVKAGKWRINLSSLVVGGPYRMKIMGENSITIKDILVGEVWFTCGQSNMMFGLSNSTGGKEFYQKNNKLGDGRIRVINELGPTLVSKKVNKDVIARWKKPSASYSAVSYYYAYKLYKYFQEKVPVGIITYTVILPAEAWVDEDTLRSSELLKPIFDNVLKAATKCFNGVISPISPYGMRGAIYYQAEYNGFGDRAFEFRYLMPALIKSWRKAWESPKMPFLFVQLPGFIAQKAPPDKMDMDSKTLNKYSKLSKECWTVVRESQLLTWQKTPNTGMVVTIDIGERYNIHPPNKEPVADRLLVSARKIAYGENIVYSGPVPSRFNVKGNSFIVSYDYVGSGLFAKGGILLGFEIADSDRVFYPANAIIDKSIITIFSAKVKNPIHLRYAWGGFPKCTLYNKEGLPASPFRYSVSGKSFPPNIAQFRFLNPSFEKNAKDPDIASYWGKKAKMSKRASEGTFSIKLAPNMKIYQDNLADGTGCYWNCDPDKKDFLRPGYIAGYSVDMAVNNADNVGKVYMNLCLNSSASGYQTWGGTFFITSKNNKFVKRSIVHRMTDKIPKSIFCYKSTAGGRFINMSKGTDVFLDNFSPVRIVRSTLSINSVEPINLGTVKLGLSSKKSKKIIIKNNQPETLPKLLNDKDVQSDIGTILYGCANFVANAKRGLQKVVDKTDNVVAVLMGENASLFEFISNHTNKEKNKLKLIGQDNKFGLLGGENPETEEFMVRFKGNNTLGEYKSFIRVVTQATNIGTKSKGNPGEPSTKLFYIDIPIFIRVEK